MRAAFRKKYGPIDNLEVGEQPRPVPKDDEVLVEVRASSINPADLYLMMGIPWVVRLIEGLYRPRRGVMGRDFAGVVAEIGKSVENFSIGDEIFGEATQTWADYAVVNANGAGRKPANISFEEAACVPLAGLTALQAIKKVPDLAGKRVLIVGASGGVGTFAVQIAAAMGAHVIGLASTRNLRVVRGLGASQVESYEDPEGIKSIAPCDVVIDTVCDYGFREVLPWLSEGGAYVVVGAPINTKSLLGRIAGPLGRYLKLMLARKRGRRLVIVAAKANEGLGEVSALLESRQIRPLISKRFQLNEAPQALHYSTMSRPAGKIILEVRSRGS